MQRVSVVSRGPDIDLAKGLTSVTTTEDAAVVWEELE